MHDPDDNKEWDGCTSEGGDIEPGIPEEQARADQAETGLGRVCWGKSLLWAYLVTASDDMTDKS